VISSVTLISVNKIMNSVCDRDESSTHEVREIEREGNGGEGILVSVSRDANRNGDQRQAIWGPSSEKGVKQKNDDNRESYHNVEPMVEDYDIAGSKISPKFVQSSKLKSQVKPTCSKKRSENPHDPLRNPPCKSRPM
jgi:hypothetical protein